MDNPISQYGQVSSSKSISDQSRHRTMNETYVEDLAHGLAGGRIAVEEPRARVDPGVDEERAGVFDKEDRLPGHLRSQILKSRDPKKDQRERR